MDLDNAIEKFEQLLAELRAASLADNRTVLDNSLSLDRQGKLIGEGRSPFGAVVFGDLNGFKRINDEHSHAAGDLALSAVGNVIKDRVVVPLGALAFRPSGDEFVILLKEDSVADFLAIAPVLGKIPFSYKSAKLRVALSFGYAFTDPLTSFDDLLGRAELACQMAKLQGDGVCLPWSREFELNPSIRLTGSCRKCNAKISCNVDRVKAPNELSFCPCCGEKLIDVSGG